MNCLFQQPDTWPIPFHSRPKLYGRFASKHFTESDTRLAAKHLLSGNPSGRVAKFLVFGKVLLKNFSLEGKCRRNDLLLLTRSTASGRVQWRANATDYLSHHTTHRTRLHASSTSQQHQTKILSFFVLLHARGAEKHSTHEKWNV